MIKTLYAGRIVYAIGYKKDFQKWENKKKKYKIPYSQIKIYLS